MGSEAARQVGAGSSYRMVGQEKSQTVGKYRVWCWWWPKGVLLPHIEIWLPDPTKTAPNSKNCTLKPAVPCEVPSLLLLWQTPQVPKYFHIQSLLYP